MSTSPSPTPCRQASGRGRAPQAALATRARRAGALFMGSVSRRGSTLHSDRLSGGVRLEVRSAALQRGRRRTTHLLGLALSAFSRWQVVNDRGAVFLPVYEAVMEGAAGAEPLRIDDTHLPILGLSGK